jgi:DNA-binding response OmpR family regulator
VAANADDALRLADEKGPLHLLVVDLPVPDASGDELPRRLALCRPDVPVLYLSVYPAEVVDLPPVPGSRMAVLAKPFGSRELLWAVRQALAGTLAAC